VQPECVSDFIAAMSLPPALVDAWTLEPPFGLEQTLTRLLDQAADPAAGYRRYAAQVLASAPDRLREHPLAGPAVRALELDLDSSVRSVLSSEQPQPNGGIVPSPTPAAGPPPGVALVVEEAAIRRPSAELDHLSGPAPEDLCLRDISFHVRSGELLAIVCDDPAASRALLRAVAGFDPIADGILLRAGHGVLVSDLGSLIEPTLSVRENIILLASYLGGHAGESARQAELHAARAGVQDALDNPLLALAAAAVERLTITLALECVRAPLLLLDHLPPLQDAQFSRWVRDRAGQRRQEGISMLEAGSDGSWVLGPPDRILWLERGDVVACGHADSVLDAIWKRQLGLVTAS
jgi:ABC-type polysaccharide/polyol phosphate transport system ATPase subunit